MAAGETMAEQLIYLEFARVQRETAKIDLIALPMLANLFESLKRLEVAFFECGYHSFIELCDANVPYPKGEKERLDVINRLIVLAKKEGIVIDTKVEFKETHWSVTNSPKMSDVNLWDLDFVIDCYNDESRYK
jgi:hypothetical protein